MEFASYEQEGDRLVIRGDLTWPLDMQFDIATSSLLAYADEHGVNEVTVDVLQVDAMGSQYLGALAAVAADMKKRGGALTVKAKDKVAHTIKVCGLDRLLNLDTA